LFSARRQTQDLVVLSPSLSTWQWTIWIKSEGRLDAAKVDLSCPDPSPYATVLPSFSIEKILVSGKF
jgi:hypothetical protein